MKFKVFNKQFCQVKKVLLGKKNEDIEFAPVYFNSTTKKLINSKYILDKSFPEIFVQNQ